MNFECRRRGENGGVDAAQRRALRDVREHRMAMIND